MLQSNTPGDPHTIHPHMFCSVRTMCIALLHEYMYACACPTSIPNVCEQDNACCRWCMRTCECVWAAWWVCKRASQHVGACILIYTAIFNERWALISFGDICGSARHCICCYTLTNPLPIPSPTTLGPNISRVLSPS